jgi:alcohol dehydrogenase
MSPIASFQIHTPTPIEFGVGVAAQVGERAAALQMRHAFLVTDQGLVDSPACSAARRALEQRGVAVTVYADVVLDPTAESVSAAVQAYRAAAADGLIALGGGSAMDTAKALGVLAVGGGDDIVPYFFGGPAPINGIPPLICLPTTAGTGSEVTFVAIITHEGHKKLLRAPSIGPALALIDPALTLSMPPRLTASTGMDALAHSLEAMTSTVANPICDTLALDAITRIGRWLPRAVEQGDDIVARTELSLAALNAGMAFLGGRVHLGHAVGHSMGTVFHVPHGFACTMCMPALLTYLQPVCEEALARVGAALGNPGVADAVSKLMAQCHAPLLGDALHVHKRDIPRLVEIVEGEQRLIGLSRRQPAAPDWAEIFAESI